MLTSIGKQSGESVESVLGKKKKSTMRRICTKGKFWAYKINESDGVMDDDSGESMELMEEVPIEGLGESES